jgi:NitT/TauT family transport system substrate-binding protein
MINRRFRIVIVLVVLIGLLAGCSTPAAPQAELTPVRVQLAWVPTIEYSPYYVAEHTGLFEQHGIAVEFINGGFDENGQPIDQVARVVNGDAEFGMAPADQVLVARSNGAPIVAIAALYQRSPIAFISLAENNITKPEDFIGKTVFVDDVAGATGIAYAAMMSSLEIDRSQINEIPRDDFSNEPLTSGRVDVMSAFVNNQPVQLQLEGQQVNTILASDYGIDIYANVIFTTEDMIATHPELVERFLQAVVQGIDAAVSDPQRAAEITVAKSEALNLESETQSMQQALPLFKPAGTQVGMMTDAVWIFTSELMIDQGLLPANTDIQSAYTLQFLNQIYGD